MILDWYEIKLKISFVYKFYLLVWFVLFVFKEKCYRILVFLCLFLFLFLLIYEYFMMLNEELYNGYCLLYWMCEWLVSDSDYLMKIFYMWSLFNNLFCLIIRDKIVDLVVVKIWKSIGWDNVCCFCFFWYLWV